MKYFWNGIAVHPCGQFEAAPAEPITRAGVLPVYLAENAEPEFLFMTPRHKPGFTPPRDQIAKGGRLVLQAGKWTELDDRNRQSLEGLTLEPFIETAMREGQEELGLRTANIAQIYEVGPVQFLSEKKRAPTWMYLFAAQIRDKDDFENVLDQPSPPVAQVRWLTLERFGVEGRVDHRPIVNEIWKRVKALL